MNKNTLLKGLLIVVVGGVTVKFIKEITDGKLQQKEENVEELDIESQN